MKRTPKTKPKLSALRAFLNADGVRVNEVADTLDIDRTTLWRWSAAGVPVGRLAEVSKVTGLPVAELRPDLAEAFAA